MKKVEGLSKKKKKSLTDTDSSMVITGGKGGSGEVEGRGGINGDGRRLHLGW